MSEIYKKGNNIVYYHTLFFFFFFFFLGGGGGRDERERERDRERGGWRVGFKYSRINEVETVSYCRFFMGPLSRSRSSSDRIQDQIEWQTSDSAVCT